MLSLINQFFTFYCIFPALVFLGIYLSFRLRFLQFSKFFFGVKQLFKSDKQAAGNLSHIQTIAAVLAGNFGTGNIAGMAVALSTGGPGSLVWMWVMAFIGSIIQFVSCVLGVKYRQLNESAEYVGGPMYYLSKGLGQHGLAIIFSIAVLLGSLGVGVFAQINSMVLAVKPYGASDGLIVMMIMLATAAVVLGGSRRIAQVSTGIIPVMAILYLGASFYILVFNISVLPQTFMLLFKCALHPASFSGGLLGYSFMQVVSTGLGRALFATDVGTGYVPILQAGAKSTHPIIDGLVALVAPFLVMVVCTLTGLVLIVTDVYDSSLKSTQMVLAAFQMGIGPQLGGFIVSTSLMLFGFTTLIAWACCFERAAGFLWGFRYKKAFQLIFLAMIPIGSFLDVDTVWLFADLSLTCMTLCNLVAIFGLSEEVILQTEQFLGWKKSPSVLK